MPERLYLDANAGAPLLAEAREAMIVALSAAANASSAHAEGRTARQRIERARIQVAETVNARPENVIFTSGATEAASHALSPLIHHRKARKSLSRLYVGATEHPCILAGGRFAPEAVTRLPVDENGIVDLIHLADVLQTPPDESGIGAPLVALMLANNETGVIQPVAEAAKIVHEAGGYLFCDAVQALGRMPVDIHALGADFLSLSSHKAGGPQGAGALVLRDGNVRPEPLLKGGGQERRHRAGTENVAAIAGFGVAAERVGHHLEESSRLASLRDGMEAALQEIAPTVRFFGGDAPRLSNTSLFSLPGLKAEIGVIAFDLEGVAVSAGSACSSGKTEASHVLAAMGAGRDESEGAIRVSLPFGATEADIARFIETWRTVCARAGARSAA